MSIREMAHTMIDEMTEEQLKGLLMLLGNHNEPNETTYSSMEAAENDEVYGSFDSIAELMEALNA